jgi:hypothetical protein
MAPIAQMEKQVITNNETDYRVLGVFEIVPFKD